MAPELAFSLLGLLALAAVVGWPLWRGWQRRRWGAHPFPAAWRKLLQRQFPIYNRLPPPLQKQLQRMVQVFVAEKPVIGCGGLVVHDDMRVLIAAQACLMVLQLHGPRAGAAAAPYPDLREVLLYPGAFVVEAKHHQPGGVVSQGPEVRLGESWQEGRVVLSWTDVQAGPQSGEWSAAPGNGHNVVMHEFAHQLDQETGPANGAPALQPGQSAQTWAQVFQRAYDDLIWLANAGEPTLIDSYGATAPEEFFAVVTETFFMQPRALAMQHPELYGQLRLFYRLDPQVW